MDANRSAWASGPARPLGCAVLVGCVLAVAVHCPGDPAPQASSAPSLGQRRAATAQPVTRRAILTALDAGPQARHAMIDHLVGLLGNPRTNQIRVYGGSDPVYLYLTKFGPDAVPALMAVYDKGSKAARLEAMQALGHMHDPKLRSFFLAETANDDPELARLASWALIYVADDSLAEHFIQQLRSAGSTRVRGYAALALGRLGRKYVPVLMKVLADPGPERPDWLEIKDNSSDLPGGHDPVQRRRPIRIRLAGTPRREIILALQQIGDPRGAGAIIEAYDVDPSVRAIAVVAVGDLAPRKHLRFLYRAIHDDDPAVVREALRVIGQVGDRSSAGPILRRIEGQPLSTQWLPYAASALVRVGRREQGLELLRKGLFGEETHWMVYATELGRTGDRAAWAVLVEAMARPENRPADRRKWLLEALGETRDRRALGVLVSELGQTDQLDVVAVRAMERITGAAFGLWYDTPEPQRGQVLAKVRQWWSRWSTARASDRREPTVNVPRPTSRRAR